MTSANTHNVTAPRRVPAKRPSDPPFSCVALLLQGGGALGAYQGGVYEALAEARLHPDWVAGISIGAINAAIIAGNPPNKRIERLHAFWNRVTETPLGFWPRDFPAGAWTNYGPCLVRDGLGPLQAMTAGAPGFFSPRFPPPWLAAPGSANATSAYDASALCETLEQLIDFDRINNGAVRLSVGAVNVRTGNFVYFDTAKRKIRPEHILASGALPPAFAAVEIDGEHYWDGGLVSNTPLQWVIDSEPRQDTLAFQIDLWNARGHYPRSWSDVAVRQKEIQYSSRTRAATDQIKSMQRLRATLAAVLRDAPESVRQTAEAKSLAEFSHPKAYNVVHLIYRTAGSEEGSKDFDFSRRSMLLRWQAGYDDAQHALRQDAIYQRPNNPERFRAFDFKAPAQAEPATIRSPEVGFHANIGDRQSAVHGDAVMGGA